MDFKMVNCVVQTSRPKLWSQRNGLGVNFIRKTVYSRKNLHWKYDATSMSSSWMVGMRWMASRQRRFQIPSCSSVGSFMNPEYLSSVTWLPFIDQVLLTTSIFLAYMAGVVSHDKALLYHQKGMVDKDANATNTTISGRYDDRKNHANMKDAWSEVKEKLLDAINSDHDGNLHNCAVELDKFGSNRPLSLHAISRAPRLRLLCTTLQHIHKEVTGLPKSHENYGQDAWLALSLELIQGSVPQICTEWLAWELSLENKEQDKELFGRILYRLDGNDTVLQKIKRLEKSNLYADFFFFLRFGSLSNLSSEIHCLGLSLCSLTTRALQKLRNEVALNAWLLENFESVISMYEDRFELCILGRKSPMELESGTTENYDWWKKILLGKKAASTSIVHSVLITHSHMFVKRTKELRAITGWRYYYSLFLEFSDIVMPLVRAIFCKVRDAISFFFIYLIGRSLGLIYTGIRQSLSWR